jgi:uncharacterized membrane protein
MRLLGSAIAFSFLLASSARADPVEWSIRLLAAETSWATTAATGINESGHVSGFHSDAGYLNAHAVLWSGSGYVDIESAFGIPVGKDESLAHGLNDNGQIVGTTFASDPSDFGIAILWDSGAGTFTDLSARVAAHDYGRAFSVNNHGSVVGQVFDALGSGIPQLAYYWSADGASDRLLPSLAGLDSATAAAINDAGLVAGSSFDSTTFLRRATAWAPDGSVVDLHSLLVAMDSAVTSSAATGITADGTIVGSATAVDGGGTRRFAWTWTPSGGFTVLPGGGYTGLLGPQGDGAFVVGGLGNPFAFALRAVAWVDGIGPLALPTIDGFGNSAALSVNTLGVIAGDSAYAGNLFPQQGGRSWIATPIPEPATLLLVAVAPLLLLARRKWRGRWGA